MTEPNLHELDKFFSTPAIWVPGMDEAEWNLSLIQMHQRAVVTQQFVNGHLSPDQFENALHELGVDVYHAVEQWEDGARFI